MLVSAPTRVGLTMEYLGSPGDLVATVFSLDDSGMLVTEASGTILPAGETHTNYWDSAPGHIVRHAVQHASAGSTTRATLYYQGTLGINTYFRDIQRGSTEQVDVWNLSQIFSHGVADARGRIIPEAVDSGLVAVTSASTSAAPLTELRFSECMGLCSNDFEVGATSDRLSGEPEFTSTPTADASPLCPGTCYYPINWTQTSCTVGGPTLTTLFFDYTWQSSSGNLASLSNCTISELVTFPGANPYFPPSPPFPAYTQGVPNPTILPPKGIPGTVGKATDVITTTGTFVRPYNQGAKDTITATQYYRYRCSCVGGGAFQNLEGPISIVRQVHILNVRVPPPGGQWQFTVTKSGCSASLNLGPGIISK